ncbi:Acetoacetate metabolism regulatory protein AtoC [Candidatus Neptunochlamydia vexilliferae]|uniref:Acetoacetate metabolism regulatory protein AtoC n=2 Tax=Candidatus Neptunichlamydia vexilliferae TaxID=1651774 RepID=A0ABS0B031_9BACT|nr:Acetoacetate metabolism regulatory protein AtoC [Candidatus Neptunochlamydia vexilliferae]
MGMKKVLIIEKELSSRELLMGLLKGKELQLFTVEDGTGALELLKKRSFDLILSDLKGIKTLDRSNRRPLSTPLVHLSDLNDPPLKGIDHILEKPLTIQAVSTLLLKLLAGAKRKKAVIAESLAMKKILAQVAKIAKSHSNVFISGESGTGKEVIASLIHDQSPRMDHPFIRVNCAALPDTLIESEFFGHEKGAFTGALQKRIGRFERADKGTLLLDEISEIPTSLQAKLLRVVQEQEFERVGGTEAIHVDVRLVSTSNRNMKEAIGEKTFRADLYYRLNVIPIFLPPLRERKEDIVPLAKYFLAEVCERNQIPLKTLSPAAEEKLLAYAWPGNIRELRNVIEHGVVMDYSETLEDEHLLIDQKEVSDEISCVTLKELEKEHILKILEQYGGNRTQAAKVLGISVRTLRNKLNAYNF